MKKALTKTLAVIITLVMVMSSIPFSGLNVFAQSNPATENVSEPAGSDSAVLPSTEISPQAVLSTVDHITVTKLPDKTNYINGADYSIDYTGMEITIYFNDGTSNLYSYNVDGYYFNGNYVSVYFIDYAAGTVIADYLGVTTTFNVTFVPNPVDHITLTKLPDKTSYINGADTYVDLTGMEMTIYYTDSTSVVYRYNSYGQYFRGYYVNAYITDYSTGAVQVEYMGITTTFTVTIIANPVDHIAIIKLPDQTSYINGADTYIDYSGLELKIFYTNGTSAVYKYNIFQSMYYNGYYVNVYFIDYAAGAVQVDYMGKSATFNVTIVPNPVSSIEVTKMPDKTSYIAGADTSVDYTGLELTIHYTDSTSAVYRFNTNGYYFNGYYVSVYFTDYTTGTVLVNYMGIITTFSTTLTANPVDHIAVTKLPDKTSYINGADNYLDYTGLELTIYYTDSTSAVYRYNIDSYYFKGYYVSVYFSDFSTGKVQVDYMGKTTTFNVTITANPVDHIQITKLPDKTSYIYGAETYIDCTGMEMTIFYTDSTTAAYSYNVDGPYFNGYYVNVYFTNNESGAVRVDYMSMTATFNVTITANPVDHIEITKVPDKMSYIYGADYTIDLTGMELKIFYTNGTSTAYSYNTDGPIFNGFNVNAYFTNYEIGKVRVDYMGNAAPLIVTLAANPVDHIAVTKMPDTTQYIAGLNSTFDYTGMELTIYYTDSTSAVYSYNTDGYYFNGYYVSAYFTNYATGAVEVDYMGKYTTINMTVIEKLIAFTGSTTVVNDSDHSIYGLIPGITKTAFESSYIQIMGDARLAYTPNTVGLGTGTKVDLIDNATNQVVATYYIVIFGDVNGDGNVDGNDAGTIVEIENFNIIWDPVTDAAKIKAGDLNGDGNVDGNDAGIIVEVENYNLTVDQSTGLARTI